jgi:hypothetical protein
VEGFFYGLAFTIGVIGAYLGAVLGIALGIAWLVS